jgi:hypothetical protein
VALVRLAPTLEWELLAFAREVEAREEFSIGERSAAIVPDAFVVIGTGPSTVRANGSPRTRSKRRSSSRCRRPTPMVR